jgi:hypothetical protein
MFLYLSLILTLTTGCFGMVNENKGSTEEAILEQAKEAADQHLKEKYNVSVEFTDYNFPPQDLALQVYLEGYVIDDKEKEVSIVLDLENYEVIEVAKNF